MAEKYSTPKKFVRFLGKVIIPFSTDSVLNRREKITDPLMQMAFLGDILFRYVPLYLTLFSNDPAVKLLSLTIGELATIASQHILLNTLSLKKATKATSIN